MLEGTLYPLDDESVTVALREVGTASVLLLGGVAELEEA
jgi:hypothetical protein